MPLWSPELMYDLDSLIDRDPRIRSLDGMDVKRLISILGRSIEVVGVEHLVTCLLDGTSMGDDGIIRTYVGFEPSGRAHIGWKVLADQISSMLEGGANVLIFMADWHAWVNDKFDGDMAAIQATATYMEATFRALLGHPDEGDGPGALRFESASDLMASPDYWARVLRCSKNMSLARVRKTFSIMGRHEDSSEEDLSKFYYPALQAADIFEMDIDVALGGMDQRKAHMYMRDVADKWGWPKATCLHTPILSSLKASGSRMDSFDHKMSKSDPKGALLLLDDPARLRKKMRSAYLDPQDPQSPVYELLEHVVLPATGTITITPDPRFGEPSTLEGLEAFKEAVGTGAVHPLDAKFAVADALASQLTSVREAFERDPSTLDALARWLD